VTQNEKMFAVIEQVLAERSRPADNSLRESVTSVFQIVEEQNPGGTLASRDVYTILFKLGKVIDISSVSRMIAQLEMTGTVEFTGKEKRDGLKANHAIPMYRLKK